MQKTSEKNPERYADLTSKYLDLQFSGAVEIKELPDKCLYTIPSLTVRFEKESGRFTKSIRIENFRVVAADSKRHFLLNENHPLIIDFPSSGTEATVKNIQFTITKKILKDADYIKFALAGKDTIEDDGRLKKAGLKPVSMTRNVLWPISSLTNVSYKKKENWPLDFMQYERIRRQPKDPNDYCSSAKII